MQSGSQGSIARVGGQRQEGEDAMMIHVKMGKR